MAAPNQRLVARQHLDVAHGRAQRDLDLAHLEHRARLDDGLRDARALHLRAVGRPEVAHVHARVGARELAVVARDGVVGEDQVVVRRLADAQRARRAACVVPLALPESTMTWMPDVRRRRTDGARLGLDVLVASCGCCRRAMVAVIGAPIPASSMEVDPPDERHVLRLRPRGPWSDAESRSPRCSPRRAACGSCVTMRGALPGRSGRSPRASSRRWRCRATSARRAPRRAAPRRRARSARSAPWASAARERAPRAAPPPRTSSRSEARRRSTFRGHVLTAPAAAGCGRRAPARRGPAGRSSASCPCPPLMIAAMLGVGRLGLQGLVRQVAARGASAPSARRPCPWPVALDALLPPGELDELRESSPARRPASARRPAAPCWPGPFVVVGRVVVARASTPERRRPRAASSQAAPGSQGSEAAAEGREVELGGCRVHGGGTLASCRGSWAGATFPVRRRPDSPWRTSAPRGHPGCDPRQAMYSNSIGNGRRRSSAQEGHGPRRPRAQGRSGPAAGHGHGVRLHHGPPRGRGRRRPHPRGRLARAWSCRACPTPSRSRSRRSRTTRARSRGRPRGRTSSATCRS